MLAESNSNTGLREWIAKDFSSDQDVKWCPGCGDYSILKQVQTVFPELGISRENIVFISGIGCSSRFTYYMETYGMHSIHGRAAAIASGVKAANPELSVWVVSGDGDSLAIGGNHFIHLMRRNLDINLLMFNNQIYSLTKGQYSPTSEFGKITKTSPFGTIEQPFNPAELALGAQATFVARSMDRDPKHLKEMLKRSYEHKGTSFVEIYQNCPIFNDAAFAAYTDKTTKNQEALFVEQGKPMVFSQNMEKGIKLDGLKPVVVDLNKNGTTLNDLWIHDEHDKIKAQILAAMFDDPSLNPHLPRPFGVLYAIEKPVYEQDMMTQIEEVKKQKGKIPLSKILSGGKTWKV